MSTLHIYKASAGSGKTYRLVQNFLAYVLQPGHFFDEVLAITFTNKAASEMKQRIIAQLQLLGNAKDDDTYLQQMQQILHQRGQTQMSIDDIRHQANHVLSDLLHNYSRLSVGTIDAFFQRILRSFARELNISVNYNLELDRERIQMEITDRLLDMLGEDAHEGLTNWLLQFMHAKLEDDRSWNLEYDLADFSDQLFKDEFIALLKEFNPEQGSASTQLKEEIASLQEELNAIIFSFENEMDRIAREGFEIMAHFEVSYVDFSGGSRSPVNHLNKIRKDQQKYEPTKTLLDCLNGEKSFIRKNDDRHAQLQETLDAGLEDKLQEAVDLYEQRFLIYNSARKCSRHLYQLGILSDMATVMADLRQERNMLLIDDTDRLLQGVIEETETPFVYEKVGTRYKYFLLDEFQDTSDRQWRNLMPLLKNALDEDNEIFIVGDIKQSIYRWRGGNMELLREKVKGQLTRTNEPHIEVLEKTISENYRSAPAIIHFNNAFFGQLREHLTREERFTFLKNFPAFNQLFHGVEQSIQKNNSQEGYVYIKEIPFDREEDEKDDWKEKHLEYVLTVLETLEEDGFAGNDICMLVDTNWEGSLLADYLSRMDYKVISQDSLLLGNSVRVSVIILILRWLHLGNDDVTRAQLLYEFMRLQGGKEEQPDDSFIHAKDEESWKALGFPEILLNERNRLRHLPLYELTEEIIRLLDLNATPDAFLQQFRDKVLDFATDDSQVISEFLEWWDTEGYKEALNTTETEAAIRIMTIHQSKGLQFPVVVLPFLDLEFKHKVKPLMWLNPDGHAPFNRLKYLPVKHFSHEEPSIFSDQLAEESMLMTVDQLNKWYVAFTRPEQRLYALYSSRKRYQTTGAALLLSHMLSSQNMVNKQAFENYWNAEYSTFIIGHRDKAPERITALQKDNQLEINKIESHHWHQRATVRRQAQYLSSKNKHKTSGKLQWGRIVHELLSRIENTGEISRVVRELVLEGWLPEDDAGKLEKRLKRLLNKKEVAQWFQPDWQPITERELLLTDGHLLRPDRVIVKGNKAQVIDYKTGEPRPNDRKQVLQYKAILEKMGYDVMGCWIVYTATEKVESVDSTAGFNS